MGTFKIFLSLIILKLIGISHGLPSNSSLVSHRNPKFFPFYTLGRFSQDICVGTNSLIGTCVLTGECVDLGGTATGLAACSGANTNQAQCCILTQTCGAQTQYNNTYFVNSGYPQTFPGGSRCNIQVTRPSTDVCQLRIDFLDFSLAQPTGDGVCSNDYFTASGGSSPVPRICGENSGHHVYVDYSGNNPITVTVATSGSFTFNRRWHFHLQQIGCDSPSKAPSGCLQYWMDSSGWVSSFNYAAGASGVTNSIGVQGSRQIANLNYGACVKAAAGQCSITWSRPSADIYAFTVTGDVGAIDPAILGTAAVQEQVCTTDYVTIPASQQGGVVSPGGDRYCGLGIDDTRSVARPFVIYTVTDGNETPDIAPREFSLITACFLIGSFSRKSRILGSTLMLVLHSSFSYARDGFWDDWWENRYHHHRAPTRYRGCDMNIYHNNTIMFNPNYPQTYPGGSRCTYRVYRSSRRICQLKIEFLVFSLAQPTGDGNCVTDYFTVEGGLTTVPRICGENTGQHVYVDVKRGLPASIIVATTATNTFNRRWQLRVVEVKCLSKYRAPANCLQYFTQPSGFIRSFNYGMEENGNFNSKGIAGTRQIASLQYNICIRTARRMCTITYTRPTSDPNAFSLTDDLKSVDVSILGTSVLQSQDCLTDYIVIPSASQITNNVATVLTNDRFCGLGIGVIISRSLTFAVRVVTDANEDGDIANRGFYLNYVQGPCI